MNRKQLINALTIRRINDAIRIKRLIRDFNPKLAKLMAEMPEVKKALKSADEIEVLTKHLSTKIPNVSNSYGRLHDYIYERDYGAVNRMMRNLKEECNDASKLYNGTGILSMAIKRVKELTKDIDDLISGAGF
jgi:hypothetical protein